MFKWLPFGKYKTVAYRMKYIYKKKILPLEKLSLFSRFHSPELDEKLFDAKPMIMIFGQYSTGKTTFIKSLIGKDFPGSWIGPEPTTDRFMVVMDKEGSNQKDIIPGNALVMDSKFPFYGLSKFGSSFLNRFQASFVQAPFLQNVNVVDTPGVLSGEKQSLKRGYDFPEVLRWFAQHSDRIIVIFDAYKMDVPDELRCCIDVLSGHQEKVRILLNKADMVDHHHLIKVYGSLMWSLGKIIPTPEVSKVYIGSFWDEPIKQEIYKGLFEKEKSDLIEDLQTIPIHGCLRKVNDLIKRARLVKAHAYVMSYIYNNLPRYFGKKKKMKELIKSLPEIYDKIQDKYNINSEDLPNLRKMQNVLEDVDVSTLKHIGPGHFLMIDEMLTRDITKLLALVDEEQEEDFSHKTQRENEDSTTKMSELPDLVQSPKHQF